MSNDISILTAEAYQLKVMFANAPRHLSNTWTVIQISSDILSKNKFFVFLLLIDFYFVYIYMLVQKFLFNYLHNNDDI